MKYTAATWGAEGVLAEGRVSDKTRIPAPEGPGSPNSALSPTGERILPRLKAGLQWCVPVPAQSRRRMVKPRQA